MRGFSSVRWRPRLIARATLLAVALTVGTMGAWTIARADSCDEPNDSPPSACKLSADSQVEGFIESFGDVDLYAIDLPDAANLRVDMNPPGSRWQRARPTRR